MSLTVLAALTAVNDASSVITALTPLIHQAMAAGQSEITDEQIAAARIKLNSDITALDAAIAKAS